MDKDVHAFQKACNSLAYEMSLCSSAASSICNGDPSLPTHQFNPQPNSNTDINIIVGSKKGRKRSRRSKSNEELEKERMCHIQVERNRRKQMNEHLATLRNLIPCCYVPKGDQASIVGGVIQFVTELHSLKCIMQRQMGEEMAQLNSPVADVEVKLVGFEAVIKIFSERRPGQLLKTICLLQNKLNFTILRTQITTIGLMVLYSFNAKVNMEQGYTAKEIATFLQGSFDIFQSSIINS